MNISMNGMTFTILLCVIFVLMVTLYSVVEYYRNKLAQADKKLEKVVSSHAATKSNERKKKTKEDYELAARVYQQKIEMLDYIIIRELKPLVEENPTNKELLTIYYKLIKQYATTHARYLHYKEISE